MSSITIVGDQIIEAVAEMFSAEETLRRIPYGIEWGSEGGRQRLWWEDAIEGNDGAPNLIRIRILTEVAPLPTDPESWPDDVRDSLLTSAEENLWGGMMIAEEMDQRLCLCAAVSAHDGNAGYLPMVLFRAMAAHAAARQELFESEAGWFLEELPGCGSADDMSELAESLRILLGTADHNRPVGLDEDMAFLVQQFQDFPCLMCNGDEGGLSAEFPFGEESSLLRIDTDSDHPDFGQAVSLSLILPLDGDRSLNMMKSVMELNNNEQTIHEVPWSLGSWMLNEQMSPRIGYRLWLPHGMFQNNLLANLGIGMAARARRCCESIAGMTFDEAYPLALEKMEQRLEQLLSLMGDEGP